MFLKSSHPENVVDKQPPQQDAAGTDVVQVEQLHAVQGEGQAKQVIGYPVLWCHKTQTGYWLSIVMASWSPNIFRHKYNV